MESLTEEKSERMRFCDEGVERTDLWQVMDLLWQCIFCEKQGNERKGVGFYRWKCTEDETTLRSEIQANWQMTLVVRHKCLWTACQNSVPLTASYSTNRHPRILITVRWRFQTVTLLIMTPSTQHLQSSSKLKFVTVHVCISTVNPWT